MRNANLTQSFSFLSPRLLPGMSLLVSNSWGTPESPWGHVPSSLYAGGQ